MLGLLSLLGIGVNLANDARIHNQKYFGTDRELGRNNPQRQATQCGVNRLMEDLKSGVSVEERNRRRMLGYYDGKDVDIYKR